jgi:cytoskeletal protein RodZ
MKNQYFQESQGNFEEDPSDNFDDFSNDRLVAFIKQNKPIAPNPAPNFEQQLFAEFSKYPQRSPKSHLRRSLPWALLLPMAIASSLTVNWATNRSQWQIANNPNVNQISEADRSAIEQTLISSWSVNDEAVSQTNATNSSDLQLLKELSPLEYE